MTLRKMESGAYIDFEQVNAIYSRYKRGTDLEVYAVVNGIDILIKVIPVETSVEDAMAKMDEYIKQLSVLSTEKQIVGGFTLHDISNI